MSYRDDRDADQARIDALESELAHARKRIDELEGRRDQAMVLATPGALERKSSASAARWLGAPVVLEMTRTFDFAYPVGRLEDLLVPIRRIAGQPGITELLRSSLTWRAQAMSNTMAATVSITVRDDTTTLAVTDRLHQLAGAIYGGIGGGVGGGGIALPVFASIAVPVLAPVFVGGWLIGVFAGTRAIFRRSARRRAMLVQQLFDALIGELEAARVKAK